MSATVVGAYPEERGQYELSIVIPVFRCWESIGPLVRDLLRGEQAKRRVSELILIVDGPFDAEKQHVLESLKELFQGTSLNSLKVFELARNTGQHSCVRLGIMMARGQYVLVMDCDLQDSPETVEIALAALRESRSDILITKRTGKYDGPTRQFARRGFQHLLGMATGMRVPQGLGTPILLTPRAVEYVVGFKEDAHLVHILLWLNLPTVFLEHARRPRPHGQSSYSFAKKWRHALRGILFSLERLLGLAIGASALLVGGATLTLAGVVIFALLGRPPSGWLSLVSLLGLGFGGLGLMVSLLGAAMIEVLSLSRDRPRAVVASAWEVETR